VVKAIRKRFPLIAAAAVGIGAAIALALPAGAAVSLQSQSPPVAAVALGNTATLGARGAVISVPVEFVCQPGSFAFLSVQVSQRSGSAIASGGASQEVTGSCTGSVQTVTFAITPSQAPFKKGVAFGQASLSICQFTCQTFQDGHDIRIVTK
jgi:hypothetical protein